VTRREAEQRELNILAARWRANHEAQAEHNENARQQAEMIAERRQQLSWREPTGLSFTECSDSKAAIKRQLIKLSASTVASLEIADTESDEEFLTVAELVSQYLQRSQRATQPEPEPRLGRAGINCSRKHTARSNKYWQAKRDASAKSAARSRGRGGHGWGDLQKNRAKAIEILQFFDGFIPDSSNRLAVSLHTNWYDAILQVGWKT